MPVVPPGSKVLVSGANGFIAVWVVHTLLNKGYIVHGTVRSEEKGRHLKETFKNYGDKFKLVIVDDIAREGAFDEAVKDVDAIEHTASPFHMNADDPQELIEPAVQGTIGILKSAIKYGLSVKRVVVTSSCAAVFESFPGPQTFDETHWNEQAISEVGKKGRDATSIAKYQASKALAEKAAWDLWKKHKDSIGWDLVVLNPPYVFGPALHAVDGPESLNTSSALWYNTVVLGKDLDKMVNEGSCWIDVRDLAEYHVSALQNEPAGGERIIVSISSFNWQDWVNAAHAVAPASLHWLPRGRPEVAENVVYEIAYDTRKAKSIFGINCRSMKETAKDMLDDFDKRGWLKSSEKS